MKQFKGRVVTPGEVTAEAVVTKNGFNTLASLQMALQFGDKAVKCGDQKQQGFVRQIAAWQKHYAFLKRLVPPQEVWYCTVPAP